ncbi:uncharacterized protein LOC114528390 [Dendronephthya gigantea]|uniref:uncharacterized protein LOC114528390 n=1 Tax=Dendronephthya gigantea TaxID=151771 RepID=UPI00106AF8D6|nr:uncharacterized protein LOC114528390 [Dendronephthya gigantea]
MAVTRQQSQRIDLEAQEQSGLSNETETKVGIFQSVLRKLSYFNRATTEILRGNSIEAIKRQQTTLKTKVDEAYDLIVLIQGLKVDAGQEDEVIDEWTNENKGKLRVFEEVIEELNNKLLDDEGKRKEIERREKIRQEAEARAQIRDEEREIELAKREREEEFALSLEEKKLELAAAKRVKTKLPELQISKFQGTHLDWVRFWGLFETQIDKAPMKDEAKFAYLKEHLVPKVRITIDQLPLNSEGYAKAKRMLEQRYGDASEVVNAHIQEILSLPTITGVSKQKIHNFYDSLLGHVQALEAFGKLGDVAGNVRMTLDKLEGIRADLTRTSSDWKRWTFPELVEALRQWIERNPLQQSDKKDGFSWKDGKRDKLLLTKEQSKHCVYCESKDHRSVECDKVVNVSDRKKILSDKHRCFNCTGEKHRASDCRSRSQCYNCKRRHHTSICDKLNANQKLLCQPSGKDVVYPVVVVEMGGLKCRALLDTGSGSSFASSTLLNAIGKKPIRQEFKSIEMMLQTTTRKIDVYEVEIAAVDGNFKMSCELNRIDKDVLMKVPNPRYKELIETHEHLKGVHMNDIDEKALLPVHLILGASDMSRIKTTVPAKVGNDGMPIAEKTALGWIIMSPGREKNHSYLMFTKSSQEDYMHLCSLDVLGLEDHVEGDQGSVYREFKEQLTQQEDGRYETSLPWKAHHPELPTNYLVAKRRFQSLFNRLDKQPELLKTYHDIVENQLKDGVVEIAPEKPEGSREHYIPHKPVVREQAESTKVRIVFDASAKADQKSPSLNDCLDIGPPLQRRILDILLRNRLKPILLAGDIKQAFLQIVIRENERDAMRFLWINDLQCKEMVVYRMTRAMFGLGPSPFLLGGTLNVHLEKYAEHYPQCVEELSEGTYVDDINIGGDKVEETVVLKEQAKEILSEGSFVLHKWHSNAAELESDNVEDGESTFAKETLGTKPSETKLLGLGWNKKEDTLSVSLPKQKVEMTKRIVLQTMARVYDPLGLASPYLLTAKVIFRDICDRKLGWDAELPKDLKDRWKRWLDRLPGSLTFPRSIPRERVVTTEIYIHGFADASILGCCAAVYVVTKQGALVSQGLLVSKTRLAKRDLTIPRLELVSCHMVCNLIDNVRKVLSHLPVISVCAWSDSTVCLQWINGQGNYKQFVANRVKKITEKQIEWKYVPTLENPADIGSRGTTRDLQANETWMKGPSWLSETEKWPEQVKIKPSEKSESESRMMREVMKVTIQKEADFIDCLLEKFGLTKTVRILAWVTRFIDNFVCGKKVNGPLVTEETQKQMKFLIKRAQSESEALEIFKVDSTRLNLQKNGEGIYVCQGRIQGEYPVYLPAKHVLSELVVKQAHMKTLHGGVALIMSKVREEFWIPKLRTLAKKVLSCCYGCKRFHIVHEPTPPQGNLPKERTEGMTPFEIVGVDYAGPIYYRNKNNEQKSYILIYTCSLTRGLHLELLPDLSCEEFLASFKRFVAVRVDQRR